MSERDDFIQLSNESRRSPRWTATAFYRSDENEGGVIDVSHDFMELSELEAIIERGPDWHALDRIEIRYNAVGPELTIEQADDL